MLTQWTHPHSRSLHIEIRFKSRGTFFRRGLFSAYVNAKRAAAAAEEPAAIPRSAGGMPGDPRVIGPSDGVDVEGRWASLCLSRQTRAGFIHCCDADADEAWSWPDHNPATVIVSPLAIFRHGPFLSVNVVMNALQPAERGYWSLKNVGYAGKSRLSLGYIVIHCWHLIIPSPDGIKRANTIDIDVQ